MTDAQRSAVREYVAQAYLGPLYQHARPNRTALWPWQTSPLYSRVAAIAVRYASLVRFPLSRDDVMRTMRRAAERRRYRMVGHWHEHAERIWVGVTGCDDMRDARRFWDGPPVTEFPQSEPIAPIYCWVCGEVVRFVRAGNSQNFIQSMHMGRAGERGARLCHQRKTGRRVLRMPWSKAKEELLHIIEATNHTPEVAELVALRLTICEVTHAIDETKEQRRQAQQWRRSITRGAQ